MQRFILNGVVGAVEDDQIEQFKLDNPQATKAYAVKLNGQIGIIPQNDLPKFLKDNQSATLADISTVASQNYDRQEKALRKGQKGRIYNETRANQKVIDARNADPIFSDYLTFKNLKTEAIKSQNRSSYQNAIISGIQSINAFSANLRGERDMNDTERELAQKYEINQQASAKPEDEISTWDNLLKPAEGDNRNFAVRFKDIADRTVRAGLQSAPISALSIGMTTFTGNQFVGTLPMFLMATGQQKYNLDINAPEIDEATKQTDAIITGLIEYGTEAFLGEAAQVKKWSMVTKTGKATSRDKLIKSNTPYMKLVNTAKNIMMGKIGKRVGTAFAEESLEGGTSQLLGNTTDYLLGISKNPNVFDGVMDAALIEGLSAAGSVQSAAGVFGSLNAMSKIHKTAKGFESAYNKVMETELDQTPTKDLYTTVNDFVQGIRDNDLKKTAESRDMASQIIDTFGTEIDSSLLNTAKGMFETADTIYQGYASEDDIKLADAWVHNKLLTSMIPQVHPYLKSNETAGTNQKENIDINRLYATINESSMTGDVVKAREAREQLKQLEGENPEADNALSMLEERINLTAQNITTNHKALKTIENKITGEKKTVGEIDHSKPYDSAYDYYDSLKNTPSMEEAITTGNTEAILSRSVFTLLHNALMAYNGMVAEMQDNKEMTPEQYRKFDLLYNRLQHHERNAMLFLTDQELIDLPDNLKLGKMKNLESELKQAEMPEDAYEAIVTSNYEKAAQSIDKSAEARVKKGMFPVTTEDSGEGNKVRIYHYDKGILSVEYDEESKVVSAYKTEDGTSTTLDRDILPEYINQLKVTDIIPEAKPNVDVVKQQAEEQKNVARQQVDALNATKQAKLDTEEKIRIENEKKRIQAEFQQIAREREQSKKHQAKSDVISNTARNKIKRIQTKKEKELLKQSKDLKKSEKKEYNPLKKVTLKTPIFAERIDTGNNIVVTDENQDFYWTSEGKKVKKSLVKTYDSEKARTKAQTPVVRTQFELEPREQEFKYYNPEAYSRILDISQSKEIDSRIVAIARELVKGFAGKGAVDVKLAEQHYNELIKVDPKLKTNPDVKAIKTAINSMQKHIQLIKDAFMSIREISGAKSQYTETKDYAFGKVIGKQVAQNKVKSQSQIPSRTEYILVTKQPTINNVEYVQTSTGQNYHKYRFTPLSAGQFMLESDYKVKSREAGRKRFNSREKNYNSGPTVGIPKEDLMQMRYAFALYGTSTNAKGADAFNGYKVDGKDLVSVLNDFNKGNEGNSLQQIMNAQKRSAQQKLGTLDPEHLWQKVSEAGNLLGGEDADMVYERAIEDLEYYTQYKEVKVWETNVKTEREAQAFDDAYGHLYEKWYNFIAEQQTEYPNIFEEEPLTIPDAENMEEEAYKAELARTVEVVKQEMTAVLDNLYKLQTKYPEMSDILRDEINELTTKIQITNDDILNVDNLPFLKAAEYGYSGMNTKQSAELLQTMFPGFETSIEYPSVGTAILNVGKNIRIRMDMLNDLFQTEQGDKAAGSVKNLTSGKISTLMRIAQNYNKNNMTLYHESWHLFKMIFKENEHFRSLDKYMASVFDSMVKQVKEKGWDKTTGLGKELMQSHFKDKINNPKYRDIIIEEMQADYFARVMFKAEARNDVKGIKKLMQDFMKWLVDTMHKLPVVGKFFQEAFNMQDMDRLFMESAFEKQGWEIKDSKGNIIQYADFRKTKSDGRYIIVERYQNEDGRFYAPEGEAASEFGNTLVKADIDDNANIYTLSNSTEYLIKNKIPIDNDLKIKYNLDKWEDIYSIASGDKFGEDPYSIVQMKLLNELLKKDPTIDVIHFTDEDDLNPEQYWIINQNVIKKRIKVHKIDEKGNVYKLNIKYKLAEQSQIEDVRKQYQNTDKYLKAPNGKPTNLNERQWLQVRTPNFKNWFGDWENDIGEAYLRDFVDVNNEPKLFYHGTSADDNFSIFNPTRYDDKLSWFATESDTAESWADLSSGREGKGSSPRIIPVFIAPYNYWDYSKKEDVDWLINQIEETFKQSNEELLGNRYLKGYGIDEIDHLRGTYYYSMYGGREKSIPPHVKKDIEKGSYLKLENKFITSLLTDNDYWGLFSYEFQKRNLGIYDLHRFGIVKSATANNGEFDSNNPDIRYKQISDSDLDLYNEVSKKITKIQDRTEIYERISQDTGVALPQVIDKFGRMMDRAERVTSGTLEGLYKANNLLNALDTVKNNKIRNRNNMTLSVRSAKHLMHTMQFTDEQWQYIGQDAYSIPIASMQILAVANQYGVDFLAIKDKLKDESLLPIERTEYREAAKILISEYTKAMSKYNAILSAAGRTLRYAKEKNYARIERLASNVKYMIAEVDGSQAAMIIEQNTAQIKLLKAELNKINAQINQMTENGEYTSELDALNERANKIIDAISELQQFNRIAESQDETVSTKELINEKQLDDLLKRTKDVNDPGQIEKLEEIVAPDIMDALQSMYYAAILSGPSTHAKNIIDTAINSTLNNIVGMITNPLAAPGMAIQPFMNIGNAFQRAGQMMTQETWQSQKFNVGETNTTAQNIYAKVIRTTGYIGRLLAAEDAFTNTLIQSSFMYSLAVTESRRTGASVEQLMKNPTVNMVKQAEYEARRSTYNNTPEGFVGIAINNLANWIAENRYHNKVAGYALVNIIPFTRIVGNVLNAGIDWTPLGIYRAIQYTRGTSTHQDEIFGKKASPYAMRDFSQQITKVILGTLGMSLLYMVGAAITGAGPDDLERKQQLQASGWQPYSIKIGNTYVSYQYATGGLALPLSVIGNLRDQQEFGTSQKGAFDTLLWSVMGISKTIMDKSFFSGVTDVIEAVQNKNENWLKKYIANTVTNPLIPNLFKQINNQFDKNMSKPETIIDYALINLKPYVNAAGWQPVPDQIDIFGNPRKRTGGAMATLGYSIGTPQQIIAMNGVDISNIIQSLNNQKVFMKIGSEPPDFYTGKDVKMRMTDSMFHDFQIYRGKALGMYLLMKQQEINYYYQTGNTERQQKLIDKITRRAREEALRYMGDYRYE